HILENTNISFHLCADDIQLYISFSSSDSSLALASLSHALDSVYSWFTLNRLSVNPKKTEYLLIGTQQQRSKITDFCAFFPWYRTCSSFFCVQLRCCLSV